MPNFRHYTQVDIESTIKRLWEKMYTVVGHLDMTAYCSKEPLPYKERTKGKKRAISVGESWGQEIFDCAWFNFIGRIPSQAKGRKIVALIDLNGELCIFDKTGTPVRGLTNKSSAFARFLGEPLKRVYEITPKARGNEKIDFWADAGFNDLFGIIQEKGVVKQADVAVCNVETRALYYDIEVLNELREQLPKESARHQKILRALRDVCNLLVNDSDEEIVKARKILKPMLEMKNGDTALGISAVGHAHIDLGWLWPVRETIRKGARTFATALDLIKRYPKYVFGASQPQLFLWMKETYPKLYAKIKDAVKKGRIEPQGAAWVECDTNMPSGEALVRQMLLGKRFFMKEFGIDVRHLWLPDVFGYTAALPRILLGADIDIFMTQKLSWSKVDVYPHHSFIWQGIGDGSVLSHLLPEDNYNSAASPKSAAFTEKNYKDKDVSSHALMCFGIGNGGGGPGMEHLERLQRIENLAGICPVTQEPAENFFEKWRTEADRFEKWTGELYVEMHQGTLTTHGNTKRYNRLSEIALRELELLSVVTGDIRKYPQKELEKIWQEVLLYQFHDILPGSSIKRVYDEAYERYETMLAELNDGITTAVEKLAASVNAKGMKKPYVVFNSLPWCRFEWVKLGKAWKKVFVPSMGYTTVDAASKEEIPAVNATANMLENDLLRVKFDAKTGQISSIYDKTLKRETLLKNERANRLEVHRDRGDAWDFPMDYASQKCDYMTCLESTPSVDGPRAIMTQQYEYQGSTLTQQIILTAGSTRVDFSTKAQWNTQETMLRATFPVDVQADCATFEIQFGNYKRTTHNNTTWDMAKHEVAAQRFADLSQRDFGVALLNDCKYGYKVKNSTLELNLIRCVPYPHAFMEKNGGNLKNTEMGYSDVCSHTFTYSIMPHQGDCVEGGVMKAGYELNIPVQIAPATGKGRAAAEVSFFGVDNPNVVIETVKKAEDSDALIIRMYESTGGCADITLSFAGDYTKASLVNLMEKPVEKARVTSAGVKLSLRPFEIKSVMLEK